MRYYAICKFAVSNLSQCGHESNVIFHDLIKIDSPNWPRNAGLLQFPVRIGLQFSKSNVLLELNNESRDDYDAGRGDALNRYYWEGNPPSLTLDSKQ